MRLGVVSSAPFAFCLGRPCAKASGALALFLLWLEAHTARTGIVTGAQSKRRAAIVAELAEIEQQKSGVAA